MVYGERWMPYDGHPIELGDGRRVPLETLLVEARRLRAAELRSLWAGVRARDLPALCAACTTGRNGARGR
jgi:hypothetical protein